MFIRENGLLVNDGAVVNADGSSAFLDEGYAGPVRYQPGLNRPFIEDHPLARPEHRGRPCVQLQVGMKQNKATGVWSPKEKVFTVRELQERGVNSPTWNAFTMRRRAWEQLQSAVVRAHRLRLKAWSDLMNLGADTFDGMGKLTYEYDAMSDPGEAVQDMDGLSAARTDSPVYKNRSVPLPITHSDFWFSARRQAVSENQAGGGGSISTQMGEAAGRRIAELLENNLIGNVTPTTFGTRNSGTFAHDGTSTAWGYKNHPNILLKTNFTVPGSGGWTPETTYNELLAALNTMRANRFFGPFRIYCSTDWTPWLGRVFATSGGNNPGETLGSMIRKQEDVEDIVRLDYLQDTYTFLIVEMQTTTVQALNGMGLNVVSWPSQGGARINYKAMCIQTQIIRFDYNGVVAIMKGTTA